MPTSNGSLSTRNSTANSTVRSRTRTRTATPTSKTTSHTPSAVISGSSGVSPISSQPAAAGTNGPKPTQDGASQLTVGLAVGIGFLVLAILSILFLFYLRRRRVSQQQPAPIHTRFQSLHSLDEKRLSTNVRYSTYSTVSTPLSTVDEEREDELDISESQAKRKWPRTILSIVGRLAWQSRVSDRQTGAKIDKSERQIRPRPPPVSRGRLGRAPRR
ncbi:unnamed protein product [Rhizoctonia solani]|uniref:Uncharacterized protein n=1 Tax=Rhizoctonia solani TaxID=456999 RepID=A0A8H3DHD5_9AGAM|nr:unnamed protein product [Rhizoctonia solani]